MNWISVAEQMPPNSSQVFITDGKDISTAHWFAKFAPPHENDPGEWVNQHYCLTGGYIENPTHWMAIGDFLEDTRKAICDCGGSPWCCGDPNEI